MIHQGEEKYNPVQDLHHHIRTKKTSSADEYIIIGIISDYIPPNQGQKNTTDVSILDNPNSSSQNYSRKSSQPLVHIQYHAIKTSTPQLKIIIT